MRIRSIHIEHFGKLQDFSLELQPGLNRICAGNGWGKSTLAAFLKAMFYGLDYTTKRSLKDNERKKYLPWQGGAFGGSLEFEADGRAYRAERFFGSKDKEDTFRLFSLETGLESQDYSERLGEELFHLDRAAFERSSFFTQQDFAAGLNDSLNARLTRVEEDAGDMQNYERAAASLEARMKYFQKTGGRGQIGKLEQELQGISAELLECQGREEAAVQWQRRLEEKERGLREQRSEAERLEQELQRIRAYEAKAARREQYEFLRREAAAKEEKRKRTKEELEAFDRIPSREEELDLCREWIYRVQELGPQEAKAEEELQRVREARKAQEERLAEDSPSAPICWIGAGILLLLGLLLLAAGKIFAGIILTAAGAAAGSYAALRGKKAAEQKREAARQLLEAKEAHKRAEERVRAVRLEREELHGRICRSLFLPEKTGVLELADFWRAERQRSREYEALKLAYEERQREAKDSRERFLAYQSGISPEEQAEFLCLQKPERTAEELQSGLSRLRSGLEQALEEQSQIRNRLSLLKEQAERIPELLEEQERLQGEIRQAREAHGLLEKTLKYLKTARDQFSTRYLKELQQGFLKYLAVLEPEAPLEALMDVKLKVKVREAGALRELEAFSAGWQDLIQIAQRLSIVDALYEEEEPVLVFDDPFVNLDDEKRLRAMELLEKMSEKRQVLYFTCRREA